MNRGARSLMVALLALTTAVVSLVGISPTAAETAPGPTPYVASALANNQVNLPDTRAGQVTRLYASIFARLPDARGLGYWLEQMSTGATYQDVAWSFLASKEWQDRFADVDTDGEFLDLLYEQALGRPADSRGKAYWLGVLAQGFSREDLVPFFAESTEQRRRTAPVEEFALNIAHINDSHSHLEPTSGTLVLDGKETDVEIGGFPRVITKMRDIGESVPRGEGFVKIHAGDAVSGTLFFTLFKGEADAAMMNEVCFDVFALGNHEFDEGDAGLVTFLDFLNDDTACTTDTLAANVVPAVGTPLNDGVKYIKPFVVKQYGGEEVGYIGIDIASKTKNSSSPLKTTQFLDEVATTQRYIDELTADGIDKIVLVSHYQYDNDLALAAQVKGLDAIVGGDSHTLTGDFEKYGLNSGGDYPTAVTDALGLPVCIVHAWEYSNLVGELRVSFNKYGHVMSCDGTPHLLLADTFERDDANGDSVQLEGADLAAVLAEIDAAPQLSVVEPDAGGSDTLSDFQAQVDVLAKEVIGTVPENLCLERIPGQGRSSIPGCKELTATNGGDIQQLVAQAFREQSFESDISLQNAGGVRIDIPAGDFTVGDAYTLLPFSNTLVNMEMTGTEIRQSLEDGIENAVKVDGSTGAYPYTAGLRFDVDLTKAFGSRVSNLEYKAKGSDTWVAFNESATYIVVTNDFLAGGQDGYTTLGVVTADGRTTDTLLDYAKSFVDYTTKNANGTLNKLPVSEYSTQSFVPLPE